jgi:hypothetical protein
MRKEHVIWGVGGLLLGVMLASKLRTLPGVKNLPSF